MNQVWRVRFFVSSKESPTGTMLGQEFMLCVESVSEAMRLACLGVDISIAIATVSVEVTRK